MEKKYMVFGGIGAKIPPRDFHIEPRDILSEPVLYDGILYPPLQPEEVMREFNRRLREEPDKDEKAFIKLLQDLGKS